MSDRIDELSGNVKLEISSL